jgi:23S rRNA (pseudouridine1915-N3)-methyltransferase
MKKIELICVGESKFKELKLLEQKFNRRINSFIQFNIKKVKEVKLRDEAMVMKKEADAIEKQLDPSDFVVGLDRKGKTMTSREFSRFLSQKISYHDGRIVFVLGGFAGLHRALDRCFDFKLSFSPMTVSHDIFRIVFLEQLYRAFTIIRGKNYHR